jgi:hypothetical protein
MSHPVSWNNSKFVVSDVTMFQSLGTISGHGYMIQQHAFDCWAAVLQTDEHVVYCRTLERGCMSESGAEMLYAYSTVPVCALRYQCSCIHALARGCGLSALICSLAHIRYPSSPTKLAIPNCNSYVKHSKCGRVTFLFFFSFSKFHPT